MTFYLVMTVTVLALALVLWARSVPRPQDLGPRPNGDLAACPDTPNCISSKALGEPHGMDPWPFPGEAAAARERLLLILRLLPNVKIIAEDEFYIAAEFRIAQIFIDDVEFQIDPQEQVVHFRSASRLGHSDFGVNRKRMQRIGDAFRAQEKQPQTDSDPLSL